MLLDVSTLYIMFGKITELCRLLFEILLQLINLSPNGFIKSNKDIAFASYVLVGFIFFGLFCVFVAQKNYLYALITSAFRIFKPRSRISLTIRHQNSLRWLQQAKHDLKAAESDMLGEAYEWVCFKCQQVIIYVLISLISSISVVKTCFHQLREFRHIRSFILKSAAIIFANAFIHSRIDYCNSLFYGLPKYLINRLQKY